MKYLATFAIVATFGGGPDWHSFAPKGSGFRISLPGTPEHNQQSMKSPQGPVTIRMFPLTTNEGTFVVGVTEHREAAIPPGQDHIRLDQARDGAVQNAKGRLRSEKKLTIDNRPAREIYVATETGHAVKLRLIADGPRLYQVMVVGNTRFLDSPDAVRFLDSFRLAK